MGENTLIIAPLSVARQTVREAKKIDLDIKYVRGQKEITGESKIWITNYEMADQFDYSYFNAIVLDESSILKSIGGKTRQKLTELCANIKYRLCCTATPAPNDYIELGNHTEFLGICKQSEMLAMFFINANKEHTIVVEDKTYRKKGSNKNGTEWRLKHHAEQPFFKWLSSWAITMSKPSDLGYSDNGFILPKLTITPIYINSEYKPSDQLFFTHLHGITDRTKVRKTTIDGKKIALYSLLNLWYNNSNEYANVLETILPSTQGETIEASEGQDKKLNSNPKSRTQGIHEIVSSTQHNKVETYSRATAESQRPQEGIILSGRNTKNNSTEKGARLGKRTSRYEAQPTIEEIQNQPSGLYNTNGEARQPLRNMQDTIKQPQDISVYRPLPQDRESEGVIVRELQPRIRQNEGLTGTAKDGCPIPRKQLIIWCGMDAEQRVIENICKDLKLSHSSVYGSLSADEKEKRIESWLNKETLVLISKPKICGFGLNLQQSHRMIFFGINDSWEVFYQCIRREWRYGQPSPVDVYLIIHEAEAEIHQNILRKDAMAKRLKEKLIEQIKVYEEQELGVKVDIKMDYTEKTIKTDNYTAMLGDSCERLKEIPENSIDLSVYSPPFGDLFVYSSSDRDLGNSKDWGEFFEHYKYVIREILRVTKQGRLTCVHTSDIPAMAQRDGYIGIRDFPGEVIRAYEKEGWVFVGRAFVPKNPQAQAIRTHSSALLFVSLRRDSSDSRPALIDQILLFKKDGENQVPVLPVKNGEIDNETWIKWANGVWDGISESDTLQFSRARGVDDEKHICPLQLGTIERCIKLYSNPNEMVLDPFNGIGSTGYMALKLGRKYTGIELKREYFDIAINNLKRAVNEKNSRMLI
jgi:DNA modification methylase